VADLLFSQWDFCHVRPAGGILNEKDLSASDNNWHQFIASPDMIYGKTSLARKYNNK
jgi:hypothetical protein